MAKVKSDVKPILRCASLPIQRGWLCDRRGNRGEAIEGLALWQSFQKAWQMSTRLANWAIGYQVQAEFRAGTFTNWGPCPVARGEIYKHALTRKQYPDEGDWKGLKESANAVIRSAEEAWRKNRAAALKSKNGRWPRFDYPVPFPVVADAWKLDWQEGRPLLLLRLPSEKSDVRLALELRNGGEFARQIRILEAISAGEVKTREIKIYRQRTHASCRRWYGSESAPNGEAQKHYRIMIAFPYQIRPEAKTATEALIVQTHPKCFLLCKASNRPEWIFNGDDLRRRLAENFRSRNETYARWRQRFAEDRKYEKRYPNNKRRQMNGYSSKREAKHKNRVRGFIGEVAMLVLNYALRCKVGAIIYCDKERGYLDPYPFAWHRLKLSIAQKAEELGIAFASTEELETPPPD